MKYAIIIPDGAADEPLDALGGKTPLEAAHTPHMDRIALEGRQGTVRTIPDGFESGSDVATMSLLGYDPARYHTGRAPLEAAALGIPLTASDVVFRCNLVTIEDGVMIDHSAGGISDAEAQQLIRDVAGHLNLPDCEFHTGVSYRNLLVIRDPSFSITGLKTTPPHEIPTQPVESHLPQSQIANRKPQIQLLLHIFQTSGQLFADHPVNRARIQAGKRPATHVWLWGQGHAPNLPPFPNLPPSLRRSFASSLPSAMITSVDLLRGLACLIGWQILNVPGMTSFHDTDYAAQGAASVQALDAFDLVLTHIEAPDEASHQADFRTKVAAIEAIDTHIVGPLLARLRSFPQWRILVTPDHQTLIRTRKHGYAPVPFAMAGMRVSSLKRLPYCERNAASSDLHITHGHELMEYFLKADPHW